MEAAAPSLTEKQQQVSWQPPVQTAACLSAAPSLLLKAHTQGLQKQG